MTLLCWLGWHRWHVYPQATPLWGLERGYVRAVCARCGRDDVLRP